MQQYVCSKLAILKAQASDYIMNIAVAADIVGLASGCSSDRSASSLFDSSENYSVRRFTF